MDPPEPDVARILQSLGPLPAPRRRPALVILSGLPGSGKSTIAHALAARTGAVVLQSDRLRKLLVAAPRYTAEESARVFGALHGALERLLRAGVPVVVDATNLQEQHRDPLRAIAERCGARRRIVEATAPEQVIRARLQARQGGERAAFDMSDAGEEIYDLMRARVEPIRGRRLRIDTQQDITPAIAALAAWVDEGAPRQRPAAH